MALTYPLPPLRDVFSINRQSTSAIPRTRTIIRNVDPRMPESRTTAGSAVRDGSAHQLNSRKVAEIPPPSTVLRPIPFSFFIIIHFRYRRDAREGDVYPPRRSLRSSFTEVRLAHSALPLLPHTFHLPRASWRTHVSVRVRDAFSIKTRMP